LSSIRSLAGAVLILGGVLGVSLCFYVGSEIRENAEYLQREIPATVHQIEQVIVAVQRQGETAGDVFKVTRAHLASIHASVEQLTGTSESSELSSLLQEWDAEISRSLSQADEFVQAIQTSLHSASSALLFAESIPLFRPQRADTTDRESNDLRNLADHLTSISTMLDQVHATLVEIRGNRSVDPEQIDNLRQVTKTLDAELNVVQEEIETFTNRMKNLADRLAHTRSNSPAWIMNAGALSIAFLVCLALSQGVVVIQGCRWIRPGKSTSD
jgi:chromosome segregation ATPase